MELKNKVFKIVSKIPKGKTMTYKQLAVKLKTSPKAVAKILSKNPTPISIPCHRVICNNGKMGGYTYKGKRKDKMKIQLLKKEGIKIKKGKVIHPKTF